VKDEFSVFYSVGRFFSSLPEDFFFFDAGRFFVFSSVGRFLDALASLAFKLSVSE